MTICSVTPTVPVHTGERRGPVLTTREAAKYCGLAYQTFRNKLAAKDGEPKPKKFKQGSLNVFYPLDLDAWLATRITDPEAVAS